MIDNGTFTLILDGFDELTENSKGEVERFLLESNKSSNRVIVSSRHSDIFRSWQHFHLFKIQDFTLSKSIDVVKEIDYDSSVKSKFITRLRKDLFKKHNSFASRPLLLSMMLLTFRHYADVPDKIHLFYEQAFETLATRHDIGKEMFKREPKTTYSSDLFKRYFALFCLITYNDGAFEFTTSELFDAMRKVEKIAGVDIEKQAFLNDLLDWVCVLQRDGLDIVFTHRSFQEYFACLCMLSLPDHQVGDFLRKFPLRIGDNVVTMIHDMNPDLVNRSFLEPVLFQYTRFNPIQFDIMNFMSSFDLTIKLDISLGASMLMSLRGTSEAHALRQAAYALKVFDRTKISHTESFGDNYYIVRGRKVREFDALLKNNNFKKRGSTSIIISHKVSHSRRYDMADGVEVSDVSESLVQGILLWFSDIGFTKLLEIEHEILVRLQIKLAELRDHMDKSVGEIFGFGDTEF